MLLEYFTNSVFDINIPKDILNTFVKDDEINISAIINHQAHKLNVFYCQLWKYIFHTYPSSYQFQEFIKDNNIDISKPIAIQANIVEGFLNKLYILKAGLILKINILDLSNFSNECIKKLNDENYVKECLIQKLEERYLTTLLDKNNLLFSFFKLATNDKSIISYNPLPSQATNPFTGFHIELPNINKYDTNNHVHNMSYIINSDVYFMIKIMNHPIIINASRSSHYGIINNISKALGKKCVVFSKYYVYCAEEDHYSYRLVDEYIYLLPKIAPWCLVICGEEGWKPTYKGLAIQDENNVVLGSLTTLPPTINRIIGGTYKLFNTPTFWKSHTKYSCPIKGKHAINNNLLYIDFIYKYIEKHSKKIESYESPKSSNRLILIVDNRENDLSVMSCQAAMINTEGWHCRVITSQAAVAYYKDKLPHAQVVSNLLLDKSFDIDIYNDILEDLGMWRGLKEDGYDHVMIIQDDGVLVRKGVERFLQYSYVGAPWADIPDNVYIKTSITDNMVGNGGFSLRKVEDMIKVLVAHGHEKLQTFYNNVNRIPEDVFFVKYLTKLGANFPSREQASFFSMEQIINPNCLGFHKFWNYHPYSEVKQLFDMFLQHE